MYRRVESRSFCLLAVATLLATASGAVLRTKNQFKASSFLASNASGTPLLERLLKPFASNSSAADVGKHPAFKIIKSEHVPEYDSTFTIFEHLRTGAQVLSVQSDETNKVFGITFRTPASDSTGVPHIMEHSVLCGSKKYPVKDPFIQLRRTSLQTYLNAFTYPDRTVYPVASQNLKDFYNLANVYLDAVLHPRAIEDPMVLAQEGWHLELLKKDKPLSFRGIVYNEMKGGYSAPDERLHREAMRKLFPDTPYRFDSGGDPKEIPSLTFEKFKGFYEQYYHPSNARVFFFGNDPVDKRLELLDSYLKEFGKPPQPVDVTRIQTQKKWAEPKRVESSFPVTKQQAAAPGGAKHQINLFWLLNEEHLSHEEQLGLSMMSHLLIGTSSSPLQKALMESGYGDSVIGGGYSDDLKQSTWSVGLKGVQKDNVPKVEKLIMDTLEHVAKTGFDKDAVEATMNSIEFSVREFSTASSNQGLSLYLTALSSWIYEQDPINALRFDGPLKRVNSNLKDNGQMWLEGLIEKYLIKNPHRLTLEGVPDAGMSAREEAAEKKLLTDLKASMTEDKLQETIKTTLELKEMQKRADTPEELKTLPKLSITDLERKETDLDMSLHKKQGVTVMSHKVASSGILYADLVFDLSVIPTDHLEILPLFMSLMFDVGTSKFDAETFSNHIGAKTGGLGVTKLNSLKLGKDGAIGDLNDIAFHLVVYGKCTADKAGDMFDLLLMGVTDSKLDSKDRALEILKSSKASMESSLRSAGSSYAQTRVLARRSLAGYIDEVTGGISYYQALPGLLQKVEKNWPQILSQLQTLRSLILDQDGFIINLSADKATLQNIDGAVDKVVADVLSARSEFKMKKPINGPRVADAMLGKPLLRLPGGAEGFQVPTQVNYVVKGGALYSPHDRVSGTTSVVLRLISQSYMWDMVRVLGGAYGGGCSLSSHSGTFSCYSYRDPNLRQTLAVFDKVAAHLEDLHLDSAAIEQLIIGAVGDLDKPMSPMSKGYASFTRWLLNDQLEFRQRRRDEMFATTADDFRAFAKQIKAHSSVWKASVFASKSAFTRANEALSKEQKIPVVELH